MYDMISRDLVYASERQASAMERIADNLEALTAALSAFAATMSNRPPSAAVPESIQQSPLPWCEHLTKPRKKMKTRYTVVCSYVGYSREIDDAILGELESRDRRLFGGSGFSSTDGRRELIFDTIKLEIAQRLQTNLRKAAKTAHYRVRVTIDTHNDD